MSIIVCAGFAFLPSAVATEPVSERPALLERRLAERSRDYLQSIQDRAAKLPPGQRERLLDHAQTVVLKGFVNLRLHSRPVPDPAPFDSGGVVASLQKIDGWQSNPAIDRAVAFLNANFHQPSEGEIALRVALPSRFHWERVHGVLAKHYPFGGFFFGGAGGSGIVGIAAPVSPSTSRIGNKITSDDRPCTVDFLSFDRSVSRFHGNENLLIGFPAIAQTIVLRI